MTQINLEKEIEVVFQEKVALNTTVVNIEYVTYDGSKAVACISFGDDSGKQKILTLWEGEDYVNIGQWTDTDVQNRIVELLSILTPTP